MTYDCHSEMYGGINLDRKQTVVLRESKSFEKQLTKKNAKYVIRYKYNLNGRSILIPDNSVLEFKGGALENGTLRGKYYIVSSPVRIFYNIKLSDDITQGVDYRWFVGNDREITSKSLLNLPYVPIFFGKESYYSDEEINLSSLDYIDYHDLIISFSKNIKAYCRLITGGHGNIKNNEYKYRCKYNTPYSVRIMSDLLNGMENKIISIRTADCTLQDWRPLTNDTESNVKGNPSLFKGLTTIVTKTDGQIVELLDSLGGFSFSRSYSYEDGKIKRENKPILSTWAIYEPKHIHFENCVFNANERYSGIYIGGKDILIEGCSFISKKGTEVILSINTSRGGYIHNCVIDGAWLGGNDGTNYGIQTNSSTAIIIDSCIFRNNRRSVDFSGGIETRYCTVSNCKVVGMEDMYHSGSALGGHSTSFGNSFINNYIEGKFQVGIQCRGENELIEGNTINAFCNGAIFVTSFNTVVRKNIALKSDWGYNHTAFHIGSDYGFKSAIIIEGNDIAISKRFLYAYDPRFTSLMVKDNNIKCIQKSSQNVAIAPLGFSGVFSGNSISTIGDKMKVVDIPHSK